MAIHPNYKKEKVTGGDLNTPVTFFSKNSDGGFFPGSDEKEKLYECFALIYNPSMKDLEVLNSKGTKEGLTLKIRDPHEEYVPSNKHLVVIDDYRYGSKKEMQVLDVSPDVERNQFIKIIVGMTNDE